MKLAFQAPLAVQKFLISVFGVILVHYTVEENFGLTFLKLKDREGVRD